MAKISILVAVYNDEKHLRDCLNSLTGQTLKDIQIVCIDDCSTDGSPTILHEYAKRDNRILLLRLDHNQGQARARNYGLSSVESEYVTFLDSDDWLSPDAMEKVVDTFEEHPSTDSVVLRLVQCTGGPSDYKVANKSACDFSCLSGKEAFRRSLDWSLHGVYATRKQLFDRFPYDETCRAYSDDNTTRLHYLFSREVRPADATYFYRENPASTTNAISRRRFLFLRANESMRDTMADLDIEPDIRLQYEQIRWLNLIDTYMFYFVHGKQLTPDDRAWGLSEMKRVWHTFNHADISKRNRKMGYMPMPNWTLFRLEEWTYFSLRQIAGKNK